MTKPKTMADRYETAYLARYNASHANLKAKLDICKKDSSRFASNRDVDDFIKEVIKDAEKET